MGRSRRTSHEGVSELRPRSIRFSNKTADSQLEELLSNSDGFVTTTAIKEMRSLYEKEGRFQEASVLEREVQLRGVRIVAPEDLP